LVNSPDGTIMHDGKFQLHLLSPDVTKNDSSQPLYLMTSAKEIPAVLTDELFIKSGQYVAQLPKVCSLLA